MNARPIAPGRSVPRMSVPREEVTAFCRRNRIRWMALFGSVLSDDFGPESDVDVLVEFEPDARVTLLTLSRNQRELSMLFGRPVDFVLRDGLKRRIRNAVLAEAEVIYAA